MRFQGAVIREQGVTFVIVIVKRHILETPLESNRVISGFQPLFPGLPIILMGQDTRGVATYYGRRDLVQFMRNVPLNAVRWKEYNAA